MRLCDFPASTRTKFQSPATWGVILGYGMLWALFRFGLFTGMPAMFSPGAEFMLPFLLVIGMLALAPLPWLWTGDERKQAPPLRGFLQSLPWNALWLGIIIGLMPGAQTQGGPQVHLRLVPNGFPLRPGWGLFFLNSPLALILGWFLAGKERAEASERELRELADRSRAQALQAQLNPHVLFNVLGGLTELVHEDPDAAEEALVGLVEMYRELMRHGASLRAPLAHERSLVTRYLGIEAIRLGARLQVRWQWPDWADPLELPPLLLLPLVENAIKHGIAPQIEGGAIHIELTRTPASLLLRVSNTGQPLKADYLTGTGLGNLKERLALLPAPRPTLRLETEGAWTVARLELPKRWPA